MTELEAGENTYRAEIATRNRRKTAEERERRLLFAMIGILGYLAFSNFAAAFVALGGSKIDVVVGLVMGALYALGFYRVWSKDDMRWWPIAVPTGVSLALCVLAAFAGVYMYGAIVFNGALLVLVPLRRRAAAAAKR